jgi:2-polyprenyl-6-hydroxyphenyl methylase/3-demethylubiquinone-9 3-methyltransferase
MSGASRNEGIMANDLAIYDAVAQDWWRGETRWLRVLANLVPARLRYFDRHMPDWSERDVLDLGCGGGFMAEALARRGARVTGVDPAAKAVQAAREHAAAENLAIRYETGVGEALDFPDASFDAVVCVDVLEHVADLDRVLAEVTRVLRPGGWFLFDTINRNPLASLVVVTGAERVLGLLPRGTHDPAMFIRPGELRGRLERLGYAVERFAGIGPTGLNRRGDFTFGVLPFTGIVYAGAGRRP